MHVPRPTALRALGAAALVVAAGLLAAPAASAHNVVVGTLPADGSTVTALPTQVVLNFEEPPVAGGTAIVVRGPGGTAVTSGPTTISGASASVPLQPLTAPGAYAVTYRSASDDGHTITGAFTFTVPASVLPSASATPTPTSESPSAIASASSSSSGVAAPSSDSGSSSVVPWLLGGLAVVVVVGIVVALRRRPA